MKTTILVFSVLFACLAIYVKCDAESFKHVLKRESEKQMRTARQAYNNGYGRPPPSNDVIIISDGERRHRDNGLTWLLPLLLLGGNRGGFGGGNRGFGF